MYVDDLNIIGNTQDIDEARDHLKMEIEMKDLDNTNARVCKSSTFNMEC